MLVILAVVFIPMILTGPVDTGTIEETNIPARPDEQFRSKLVPITDSIQVPVTETDTGIDDTQESTPADKTNISGVAPGATEGSDDKAATTSKPEVEKAVGLSAWVVQLGSFSSKVNADKLNLNLRKSGFPAFVEPIKQDGKTAYRVRVGPELLRADADKLLVQIKKKMDLEGIVLRYP